MDPPITEVVWGNDWFGVHSDDDMRTNQFTVQHYRGNTAYCIDYSMLTDNATTQRCDEVTLSVGYTLHDFTFGLGYKFVGNYGGQDLQNWWHKTTEGLQHDDTYERDRQQPCLYASYSKQQGDGILRSEFNAAVFGTPTEFGCDTRIALQFHTDGEICWLGATQQVRRSVGNSVQRAVAEYEDGLWISGGVTLDDAVSFEMRYNLDEQAGTGSFTFRF